MTDGKVTLKKMDLSDFQCNPFDMIGKGWFLLTSGTPECYNTMTCSWGTIGELWGVPAFRCMVRTNRYTSQFMEQNDRFTISFFDYGYKPALRLCGTRSGRDCDKAKETGLKPVTLENVVTFEQAKRVLVCQKIYSAMLDQKGFVNPETYQKWYEKEPLHREYVGEILSYYERTV